MKKTTRKTVHELGLEPRKTAQSRAVLVEVSAGFRGERRTASNAGLRGRYRHRSNVAAGWLSTFPAGTDFSVADVAAQLGMSEPEARELIVSGPLRGFRTRGQRRIRVRAADLAAYQRVR